MKENNSQRCLFFSPFCGNMHQSWGNRVLQTLRFFLGHCFSFSHPVVINCCVKSCSEILLFPWHFKESNWSPGLLQGGLHSQSRLSSCCFRRIIYGKRAEEIGLLLRTWEWRKMNRTGGCKLNKEWDWRKKKNNNTKTQQVTGTSAAFASHQFATTDINSSVQLQGKSQSVLLPYVIGLSIIAQKIKLSNKCTP